MAKKDIETKEGELIEATTGRKSLYKPHYKDDLIDMMRKGKSATQVAANWGISRTTLYNWMKEHKELKEAFDIAQTAGEAFWEDVGNAATFGKIKGFNTKTYEMNMRNRFGWDKNDKSHQTINIENMQINNLSEEQLNKRIELLQKELEGGNN